MGGAVAGGADVGERRRLRSRRQRSIHPEQPAGVVVGADGVGKEADLVDAAELRGLAVAADVDNVGVARVGDEGEVNASLPAGFLPAVTRVGVATGIELGSVELLLVLLVIFVLVLPVLRDRQGLQLHRLGVGLDADQRAVFVGLRRVELGPIGAAIARAEQAVQPRAVGRVHDVNEPDVNVSGVPHGDLDIDGVAEGAGVEIGRVVVHRLHGGVADARPGGAGVGGFVDPVIACRITEAGVEDGIVGRIAGQVVDATTGQPVAVHVAVAVGDPAEGCPAVGRAKQPDGAVGETVGTIDRDDDGAPARRHAGDVLAGQVVVQQRPGGAAVAGLEQPDAASAVVAVTAVAADAGDQGLVGRVGRIELERADGKGAELVGEWRPRRAGRGGVGRLPHSAVDRADVNDVSIGRVRGDDLDRAGDRVEL